MPEESDDNIYVATCPNCQLDQMFRPISKCSTICVEVECDYCGNLFTYNLYTEEVEKP